METSNIKKSLLKLNVLDTNKGTSTGSNFFGSGTTIDSYSPVDGKLIGKVQATTKEILKK